MRSWISQILYQNSDGFGYALRIKKASGGNTATSRDLLSILELLVRKFSDCTLIADGLDECRASPTEMLQTIQKAVNKTHTRVLIVSRDKGTIRSGLFETEGVSINHSQYQILQEDVCSDTRLFAKSIVSRKLKNKSPEVRAELAQRMASQSKGMFLWIHMLENELNGAENAAVLKRVVEDTPKDIDRIYDGLWRSMEKGKHYERAIKILRWVTFATRPLTIEELTEAVLIVDKDGLDDLDIDYFPDAFDDTYVHSKILHVCGPLIEMRNGTDTSEEIDSERPDHHYRQKTIQLAHFSVREYLIAQLPIPSTILVNNARLTNEGWHHNLLARLCLRYVLLSKTWQDVDTQTGKFRRHSHIRREFRWYASRSWPKHRSPDQAGYEPMFELIKALFDSQSPGFDLWIRSAHGLPWLSVHSKLTLLKAAAVFDLRDIAAYLLDNCRLHIDEVDDEDDDTALFHACTLGHTGMAADLLRRGAPMRASRDGSTPLNTACFNGHFEIVQHLVEHGAKVRAVDVRGYTPLHYAVSKQREKQARGKIVRYLIDHGAEVDPSTDIDETYLPTVIVHWSWNLFLLRRHEPVPRLPKIGRRELDRWKAHGRVTTTTPLLIAVGANYIEILRLLLDFGADPNSLAGVESPWPCYPRAPTNTPLGLAVKMRYIEIVRCLLDFGANPNLSEGNGGLRPIHYAVSKGNLDILCELLERGADLDGEDEDKATALHFAAARGEIEVLRHLVDRGVSPNARLANGKTALMIAAEHGHINVVCELLDRDADLNISDENGRMAIMSAAEFGKAMVARELAERRPDLNITDIRAFTALHMAARNDFEGVVHELVSAGLT